MGCQQSAPPGALGGPTLAAMGSHAGKDPKRVGGVEVYGATCSMNSMGVAMLVSAVRCGKLVPTVPPRETSTAAFSVMNPFRQVPTLKDQGLHLGESSVILRYLAQKYANNLYPATAARRGFIDWAMDRFATSMYQDCVKTLYAALAYASAPAKPVEVGIECTRNLREFAAVFLKERFIGGSRLSIADYKVAPFFYAYAHPVLKYNHFVEVPERILQFNRDFAAACPASCMLSSGGEFSLKEMLDARYGSSPGMLAPAKAAMYQNEDLLKHKLPSVKGKVEVHVFPICTNSAAVAIFCTHVGLGKVVQCLPGEDASAKEFLRMNPFQSVPTLKDGDVVLGGSNTILRHLASRHAQEYYPPARQSFIDWALDRFATGMYHDATQTIYPCLGFGEMPWDPVTRKARGTKAVENLQSFADFFLKDKFVGGDKPSIADFKVAPAFFAYGHPLLCRKFFLELPARILQFNQDFAHAVRDCTLLTMADGVSFKATLDSHAVLHKSLSEELPDSPDTISEAEKVCLLQLEEAPLAIAIGPSCGCW